MKKSRVEKSSSDTKNRLLKILGKIGLKSREKTLNWPRFLNWTPNFLEWSKNTIFFSFPQNHLKNRDEWSRNSKKNDPPPFKEKNQKINKNKLKNAF